MIEALRREGWLKLSSGILWQFPSVHISHVMRTGIATPPKPCRSIVGFHISLILSSSEWCFLCLEPASQPGMQHAVYATFLLLGDYRVKVTCHRTAATGWTHGKPTIARRPNGEKPWQVSVPRTRYLPPVMADFSEEYLTSLMILGDFLPGNCRFSSPHDRILWSSSQELIEKSNKLEGKRKGLRRRPRSHRRLHKTRIPRHMSHGNMIPTRVQTMSGATSVFGLRSIDNFKLLRGTYPPPTPPPCLLCPLSTCESRGMGK